MKESDRMRVPIWLSMIDRAASVVVGNIRVVDMFF